MCGIGVVHVHGHGHGQGQGHEWVPNMSSVYISGSCSLLILIGRGKVSVSFKPRWNREGWGVMRRQWTKKETERGETVQDNKCSEYNEGWIESVEKGEQEE